MSETRDRNGRFSKTSDAEEALEAFRDRADQAEPLTAAEVGEYVDWSDRTVYNKLEELEKREQLKSKRAGPGKVWWVSLPKDAAPLSAMGLGKQQLPQTADEVLEIAGDSIEGRTEDDRQKRAEAVLTAYKFLQHQGSASGQEIREYTYEQHQWVEGTKQQDPSKRLWILVLRKALPELPGVDSPGSTGGHWNFIPPGGDLEARLDRDIDKWIIDYVEVNAPEDHVDRLRALVQIAYDYLKEHGEATRDDIKRVLPENYTGHYADFNGLWMYLLSDALKKPDEVEYEGRKGKSAYRYTGDE